MSRRKGRKAKDDIRVQEPEVRHAPMPSVDTRTDDSTLAEEPVRLPVVEDLRETRPDLYWPKGMEVPTTFRRARPALPCPNCGRVRTDQGGRAVVCDRGVSEESGKAYLSCKVCRHQFTMPLEREKT